MRWHLLLEWWLSRFHEFSGSNCPLPHICRSDLEACFSFFCWPIHHRSAAIPELPARFCLRIHRLQWACLSRGRIVCIDRGEKYGTRCLLSSQDHVLRVYWPDRRRPCGGQRTRGGDWTSLLSTGTTGLADSLELWLPIGFWFYFWTWGLRTISGGESSCGLLLWGWRVHRLDSGRCRRGCYWNPLVVIGGRSISIWNQFMHDGVKV